MEMYLAAEGLESYIGEAIISVGIVDQGEVIRLESQWVSDYRARDYLYIRKVVRSLILRVHEFECTRIFYPNNLPSLPSWETEIDKAVFLKGRRSPITDLVQNLHWERLQEISLKVNDRFNFRRGRGRIDYRHAKQLLENQGFTPYHHKDALVGLRDYFLRLLLGNQKSISILKCDPNRTRESKKLIRLHCKLPKWWRIAELYTSGREVNCLKDYLSEDKQVEVKHVLCSQSKEAFKSLSKEMKLWVKNYGQPNDPSSS